MAAGRRQSILALAFLCMCWFIASGTVRAQPQPKRFQGAVPLPQEAHEVWGKSLSLGELKSALERLNPGGDNGPMKQFQDLLKNVDPNDPQFQDALRQMLGNKEFMDRFKELAKQKQGEKGAAGKMSQEDLAALVKKLKDLNGPDDLQGPGQLPRKNQQPNFPKTNTNGNPAAPQPPGMAPVPIEPKKGQHEPANLFPKPGMQPQPNTKPPDFQGMMNDQLLPKSNPFGQPNAPDPRAKSMAALAGLWEQNIGPLDETPELKRVLFELNSVEAGSDFDWKFDLKDEKGNSLWDLLKNGGSNDSPLGDALGGSGDDWKMPDFELPTIGWGKWFGNSSSSSSSSSSPSLPKVPSSGSSGGSGWGGFGSVGGLGGSWVPVVILGLALAIGVAVWWYLNSQSSKALGSAAAGSGLGPWPVNPRNINTREDVVKAFEYLSVLFCGAAAKMWTHSTIAEALNQLAITHEDVAVKLARLYELARYAPLDESLSRIEVIEARHLVCDLAGVS